MKKHPTMVGQMLDESFKDNVVLPEDKTMVEGIGEHKRNCWRQVSPPRWNVCSFFFIGHEVRGSFTCQFGRQCVRETPILDWSIMLLFFTLFLALRCTFEKTYEVVVGNRITFDVKRLRYVGMCVLVSVARQCFNGLST